MHRTKLHILVPVYFLYAQEKSHSGVTPERVEDLMRTLVLRIMKKSGSAPNLIAICILPDIGM